MRLESCPGVSHNTVSKNYTSAHNSHRQNPIILTYTINILSNLSPPLEPENDDILVANPAVAQESGIAAPCPVVGALRQA